jgi:hypothetical protein
MVSPFLNKQFFEFWNYVLERQRIWYKRFILKEPYPWTNDPILQKFHFCNNYRELDKGTLYLIDKISSCQTDREKVLFNVVAYRLFNSYGFFDKSGGLMDPATYNPYTFVERIDSLIALGEKPYSPAYVIHPIIIRGSYRPKDKHVQLAFVLETLREEINQLIEKIDSSLTPKESFDALKQIPGIGSFLAYEVWSDLTYFRF